MEKHKAERTEAWEADKRNIQRIQKKHKKTEAKTMGKTYDFDKAVDRRKTSCLKYDFGMERKGRDDLLPLWVADMDFQL